MPTTDPSLMNDVLRRLAVAVLAYAVAAAVVAAGLLPALLSAEPVAALLPEPPQVVARSPHPAPSREAAL